MDAQPQEQEAQQSGYWVEIIAGSSTQAEFRRMDRDNLVRFRVQRGDETQVLFVRRGDVQSVDDASSSGGGFYIPAGTSAKHCIGQGSATHNVEVGVITGTFGFNENGLPLGTLYLNMRSRETEEAS